MRPPLEKDCPDLHCVVRFFSTGPSLLVGKQTERRDGQAEREKKD